MGVPFRTTGWRAKDTFHSRTCHESTNAYFFIQLDPTLRSIVHTWSTIKDIMILLQWMMWCIFYVGFVRDPASILVGFVGDPPSVILCNNDCRIVKTTHQQHARILESSHIIQARQQDDRQHQIRAT